LPGPIDLAPRKLAFLGLEFYIDFGKESSDGSLGSRNRPFFCLIPGLMSQSAVVRDYRALEVGRRRANRLVLTVAGYVGAQWELPAAMALTDQGLALWIRSRRRAFCPDGDLGSKNRPLS
jgi:hypothetical protein